MVKEQAWHPIITAEKWTHTIVTNRATGANDRLLSQCRPQICFTRLNRNLGTINQCHRHLAPKMATRIIHSRTQNSYIRMDYLPQAVPIITQMKIILKGLPPQAIPSSKRTSTTKHMKRHSHSVVT